MDRDDLTSFKRWFSDYCSSFCFPDEEDQRNIFLKQQHTSNVCANVVRIGRDLSLRDDALWLAETIALFHDIGRFQQYLHYKTFRDSLSVNHAVLGASILSEKGILSNLSEKEQGTIMQAITFHNAFAVPDIQDGDTLFFLRLIRDADKLDIWRLFIEYYESPEKKWASAAGLGLPDNSEYSEEVLTCIFEKRIASLASLRTLTDFKLLQISWIYDINFEASLKLVEERDYMNRIIKTAPRTDEVLQAAAVVREYVRQRLKPCLLRKGRE